jgi:hypothetical protein
VLSPVSRQEILRRLSEHPADRRYHGLPPILAAALP